MCGCTTSYVVCIILRAYRNALIPARERVDWVAVDVVLAFLWVSIVVHKRREGVEGVHRRRVAQHVSGEVRRRYTAVEVELLDFTLLLHVRGDGTPISR